MISFLHRSKPPLSRFVELFWYYGGVSLPHKQERLLPQGTMELVIDLRDRREGYQSFPDSIVSGPHSRFFVIDTACQSEVIGIHFKPGGAFPFFKLPADELQNQHVALGDLWGARAAELRERVLAAPTPQAKVEVMEQFLMAQAFRGFERHPAVGFALQEFHKPELPAIAAVTDQIGLSSRRFIQVFSEEVGLSPKLFCRVQRFQQVLQIVRREREVDWAEIALGCGYFDQAHFIHDFKEFSGINPTAYLAAKTDHLNHVPIQD
ncbi:MAG TPA: helix-turn-helix domain-containing protein [Candidatus Angelobacter sp.]|nr:helix-turn-helix domain-containing protein [Candidatus Angelobacter sp.]